MIHICTSRCNNDIDCEICEHGENIAQDLCQLCEEKQKDIEELLDLEIKSLREEENHERN